MPNINDAAIVPSSAQPIADKEGRVTTYWQRFFNALVSAPATIGTVDVTSSPFTYTAGQAGQLAVSGGTVSSITLTRNTVAVPTGVTAGLIAMRNGDQVTVTYSGLPTINFIPG